MTSVIGFVTGAAMLGALTFLPVYLQISKGLAPTVSGLMLIPMTAGILTASTLSGRYMGRRGRYRILPMIGTATGALGAGLLATLGPETGLWFFGAAILVFGAGMGCIFPVVTTAVQADVPRPQLGTATAAGVMFRQIGGSLSVAVFGAVFAVRLTAGLGPEAARLGGELGPHALAALSPETQALARTAIAEAIQPIYLAVVVLLVLAFGFALILREVPLSSPVATPGEGG